jgi:hypothetical protein
MANAEHLKLLQQGVDVWNAWRTKEPTVSPDLSEANLSGAIVSKANLRRVNLRYAHLGAANLEDAKLDGANLYGADLHGASLRSASRIEANFVGANLTGAHLHRACLIGSSLRYAHLEGAILCEADLREADVFDAQRSEPQQGAPMFAASGHLRSRNANSHPRNPCRFRERHSSEPLRRPAALDARSKLLANMPIDLRSLPAHVTWVRLDGTAEDHARLLDACKTAPPDGRGSVLIIGESTSPASQRRFASQTPGAVAVEAVDLRDLVDFAAGLNLLAGDALQKIALFAEGLMTTVSATELLRRIDTIRRGAERRGASAMEEAAMAFLADRTHRRVADLLVEMNKEAGVRVYRPAILLGCLRALEMCHGPTGKTFHEAAVHIREQNRLFGRPLPRRAVGSTLLLKGLEAEVSVILNADEMNARNLYVAMTRGSKRLVVCARSPVLIASL